MTGMFLGNDTQSQVGQALGEKPQPPSGPIYIDPWSMAMINQGLAQDYCADAIARGLATQGYYIGQGLAMQGAYGGY
jgi:hypothetical protein